MSKSYFKLVSGHIRRATRDSGCFDIFYTGSDMVLPAGAIHKFETGIRTEMSPDLRAIIKPRSGLGIVGIDVLGGVIDADYRDEWSVILANVLTNPTTVIGSTSNDLKFVHGCRLAQFKLERIVSDVDLIGDGIELCNTIRTGGFGSTDVTLGQ